MKIHFEPKDFLKVLRLVKSAVPKASFCTGIRHEVLPLPSTKKRVK